MICSSLRNISWIFYISACLALFSSGCIVYGMKENPKLQDSLEVYEHSDQAPSILVVHKHKHLMDGAGAEQKATKKTEKTYTEYLENTLSEISFMKNANSSSFDAPYTLLVETINDEQANMGLVYLSGGTFLVIPLKMQVEITISVTLIDNNESKPIAQATSNGGINIFAWLPLLIPWNFGAAEGVIEDLYHDVFFKLLNQLKEQGLAGIHPPPYERSNKQVSYLVTESYYK